MVPDKSQLWESNTDWPFHGEVLADVAAHQWWMGANPEGLRKENNDLFDINKPLSSNMIALVCSAVCEHGFIVLTTAHCKIQIVVALDEALKGKSSTVNFDEKTYAPL